MTANSKLAEKHGKGVDLEKEVRSGQNTRAEMVVNSEPGSNGGYTGKSVKVVLIR